MTRPREKSEFQSLADLALQEDQGAIPESDVYLACVALANNGAVHPEEDRLSRPAKDLLEIRRKLKRDELLGAERALTRLSLESPNARFEGDRAFLFGMIAHRRGQQEQALEAMRQAARHYLEIPDEYRALRALSNGLICVATLEMCTVGELVAIEQRARRSGFHDLVGNIQRTRAMELITAGKYNEATAEAHSAIQSYELDGCPEDRSLAICIKAISQILAGSRDEALRTRGQVLATDGKIATYFDIVDALISGKAPKLPAGHPFANIQWGRAAVKPGSIPGKILSRLQSGPATRDELIQSVWGNSATHPSYHQRLYSALNSMKNSPSIQVHFDGEKYRIK